MFDEQDVNEALDNAGAASPEDLAKAVDVMGAVANVAGALLPAPEIAKTVIHGLMGATLEERFNEAQGYIAQAIALTGGSTWASVVVTLKNARDLEEVLGQRIRERLDLSKVAQEALAFPHDDRYINIGTTASYYSGAYVEALEDALRRVAGE